MEFILKLPSYTTWTIFSSHTYTVFTICSYQIVKPLWSASSPMPYAKVQAEPTVYLDLDYRTAE